MDILYGVSSYIEGVLHEEVTIKSGQEGIMNRESDRYRKDVRMRNGVMKD
jgi:hypothetical protein